MPYIESPASHQSRRHSPIPRNPAETNAYLVGGGIASLAAAAFLIRDAQVSGERIHILESSKSAGGSMDGAGNPESGYTLRGGRMLNFSYVCLYDLLASIPSLGNKEESVIDEMKRFNSIATNRTHATGRLVTRQAEYPGMKLGFADATDFEVSVADRAALIKLTVVQESTLVGMRIQDFFSEDFFVTNFWVMFATMFAFQKWHSAMEFRRYLHRFIQEIPRIDTLEGVDRTPLNQYESIILPLTKYLEGQGVDFKYDTKVTSLSYTSPEHTAVSIIHIVEQGMSGVVEVHEHDICLITLGSMTSSSSLGSNTFPPPKLSANLPLSDDSWALWYQVSLDTPNFGHPAKFSTRLADSTFLSFTTTLRTPSGLFLKHLAEFTGNESGTGALTTFKDSNWLMSIVVPHQPHFIDQPADVEVFWGYGLTPGALGNYVQKPMVDCSGAEIFEELLAHLRFPLQPTLENAITIPCLMPYITSQFLTRGPGDRPQVIPEGSTNLAFLGQFVEIEGDVVFTVEYSVRSAQEAVYGLMGLKKKPTKMYHGDRHPTVLAKAMKAMLENGTKWGSEKQGTSKHGEVNLVSFRDFLWTGFGDMREDCER